LFFRAGAGDPEGGVGELFANDAEGVEEDVLGFLGMEAGDVEEGGATGGWEGLWTGWLGR
jgi:hypothetical protein